ncbi:GNAT family N-acetyltransferase [Brachybacterium squillarum]|uniref:GNAT family N-acetyltransferase n=1 Tax=Brachybacterium squillarum TaxID=661979 RepID=UPI002223E3EB|nr:GNAT family N-acetyltransferase [Brachybacterium squillarum]MCW1805389.1 GNAT family N-acetyltransferase [Brachybacterium squillarum]
MDFLIRAPEPAEAAALADLHVATWREAYSHLLPEGFFSAAYIRSRHRMWERVLQDPHGETVVRIAQAGGRPIGFAWSGPGLRAGEEEAPPRSHQLYAIYLLAAHHGSGAAQALLDEVLDAGPAMLWVAKENPRAIAFYTRNGFRLDGVEQSDPAAPSITDARMVR